MIKFSKDIFTEPFLKLLTRCLGESITIAVLKTLSIARSYQCADPVYEFAGDIALSKLIEDGLNR